MTRQKFASKCNIAAGDENSSGGAAGDKNSSGCAAGDQSSSCGAVGDESSKSRSSAPSLYFEVALSLEAFSQAAEMADDRIVCSKILCEMKSS